ncbi:MAG: tRNA preQ1(34) S-adenosylmethionine ribosyltransferase-isomerase QueA [Kosmotogaceae bacterium]
MKVDAYDYNLPEDLISQNPTIPRDSCRLMIIDRKKKLFKHDVFWNIGKYLKPSDLLVLNDSRVIPARLLGKKTTGANVEAVLLKKVGKRDWKVLVKPGNKIKTGNTLIFSNLRCTILKHYEDGTRLIHFLDDYSDEKIFEAGRLPIPPYIKKYPECPEYYQTIYAKKNGSVAAPTAGLHFTKSVLTDLKKMGVLITYLTLHVGLGTFRPVKTDRIEDHKMHSEYYCIDETCARLINKTLNYNGRVIAVGTTVVRALESNYKKHGKVLPDCDETNIFIYPPFEFKVVSGMVTNFHLPKSTLLMLVSAFLGKEITLKAYKEAIYLRYKFFSFGDSCLFI